MPPSPGKIIDLRRGQPIDPAAQYAPPLGGHWRVQRAAIVRAINAAGRGLRKAGLPIARMDLAGLLAAARRRARLEDFGDTSFLDPLRRLIASMDDEARLHTMGRVATRFELIHLLANRLRLEEDRKRNRGIAAEEVRRPIFITGLPRTGTTLLHSLLALDPANRVPRTWETMHPSPPPEEALYEMDRRIDDSEREIRWFHRMIEGFNRIHPVGARLPEECIVITSHSFLSYKFEATHRVPSYLDWLEEQDGRPAYALHRRFLQHLQWECPGRWVLKAPAHLFDLDALFATYPDACVVMTHRNPLEVAASNASLTCSLRSSLSDEVDPLEVGPECSRRWAEGIGRALRSRDRGCASPGRFLDLLYLELVADPLGAVRKVYARFEIPFPEGLEDRIRRYLAENPQNRFGKHRYTLEAFGLERDVEEERYREYRERFRL